MDVVDEIASWLQTALSYLCDDPFDLEILDYGDQYFELRVHVSVADHTELYSDSGAARSGLGSASRRMAQRHGYALRTTYHVQT